MLTQKDKEYIKEEINVTVSGAESRLNVKINETESRLDTKISELDRQVGMQIEKIYDMFQHFTEMIMAHIDKKFEILKDHEKRIIKLERSESIIKGDVALQHKKIVSLESKST